MIEIASLLKKERIPGDLFTHRVFSQEINYEANSFQGYEKEEREGYGLRVINPEGKLGFYAFNHALDPREALNKALEVSNLGDKVDFSIPSYPSTWEWEDFVDPRLENLEVQDMLELGDYILSRIRGEYPQALINIVISAGREEKSLLNHHEEELRFARTFFGIGVSANQTKEGDILEVYAERSWGNRDIDIEGLVQEIIAKLDFSQRVADLNSGKYPVVFTPSGSLVLFIALLYGLNGRNLVFGRSPLEGKEGKVLFSSLFSLEEAQEPWALGSCPFDDEGIMTKTQRYLINEGKIESALWDLWSAAKRGINPTGNGFRSSYRDLPEPGFSSLRVKKGLRGKSTLVGELEEGLVVDSVLGLGQSNIASGYFSCNVQLGFYVKGGEVQGRVKDVMISGNAYQALSNIKEISRDNCWIGGRILLPYLLVEPIEVNI
ncbi:MAG TPA: TldD/PmbA family protein [Candidatus Atribacteria bacterium]|nr:TldD/PmbA family protein [Candidatus Atribacteria bacterium]HPZ81079.1 TldD/PmbA family protein [Candidatus Atribacteria bacterium]